MDVARSSGRLLTSEPKSSTCLRVRLRIGTTVSLPPGFEDRRLHVEYRLAQRGVRVLWVRLPADSVRHADDAAHQHVVRQHGRALAGREAVTAFVVAQHGIGLAQRGEQHRGGAVSRSGLELTSASKAATKRVAFEWRRRWCKSSPGKPADDQVPAAQQAHGGDAIGQVPRRGHRLLDALYEHEWCERRASRSAGPPVRTGCHLRRAAALRGRSGRACPRATAGIGPVGSVTGHPPDKSRGSMGVVQQETPADVRESLSQSCNS